MIDLKAARDLAEAGAGNDPVTVSRSWLAQVVTELEQARGKTEKAPAAK